MIKKIIKILKFFGIRAGYYQKYEWDKIALRYMVDCRTILDVGCGEGRFIGHDPKRIIGVDYNKNSIQLCQNERYNVKLARVTELPFKDSSFDAVHCAHVIEHLFPEDVHKLLNEMNRVLKKDGIFCLRAPLLHRGFYHDLTHIKPYYPEAVLHYIKLKEINQTTLESIDGLYKKIKLKYRSERLFLFVFKTHFRFLRIISNILYNFGITNFRKTGYMLILKKIK